MEQPSRLKVLTSSTAKLGGAGVSTSSAVSLTVIIPVRNRLDCLERCLTSLVDQTFPMMDCQVLICDDGSTEQIEPIVNRFQEGLPHLQFLRQKARGPAAARNMGFRSSTAEIVVYLDSDVVCTPGFLARLTEELDSHPNWLAAEARIKPADGHAGPLWDAPQCETGGCYHTAAIAYRSGAFIGAGGFDETFKLAACEDVELAARLLKHGRIGFVPEAMVFHPRRRVTLRTGWFWRQHWKYVMVLAKRYGFLAFPGRPAGPFPRLRVALAALVTLPAGRLLRGLRHVTHHPYEGVAACIYALFDVLCGFCALPTILFAPVPERKNYLGADGERVERAFP